MRIKSLYIKLKKKENKWDKKKKVTCFPYLIISNKYFKYNSVKINSNSLLFFLNTNKKRRIKMLRIKTLHTNKRQSSATVSFTFIFGLGLIILGATSSDVWFIAGKF